MLIKSDLKEAQLEILAADPAVGKTGRVYFNSVEKVAKVDSGTTIDPLGKLPYTVVTGTTQQIVVENAYIANNAAQVVFTLPATARVGDRFIITGLGAGGWKIAQNANQYIVNDNGTTVTGTSGFIQSAYASSCIEIICDVANVSFHVINSQNGAFNGGAFGGSIAGYVLGGGTNAADSLNGSTSVNKINFAGEAVSTLGAALGSTQGNGGAACSTIKGYSFAGLNSSANRINTIQAITFVGETLAALAATADISAYGASGVSSATKGYFLGNEDGSIRNYIEDIVFSNDSSQRLAAVLSTTAIAGCGLSFSTKGFNAGGCYTGSTMMAYIDRVTYSNDSCARISAVVPTDKGQMCGVCSSLAGYMMAGNTTFQSSGATSTTIYKLLLSNETVSTLAATTDQTNSKGTGVSAVLKGYQMGGWRNGPAVVTQVEDLIFATEASQTIAGVLAAGKGAGAGVQY